MKSGAVVLGIFVMAGLVAGALVIAFAGRGNSNELKAELQTAGARIDALTEEVRRLNEKMSSLHQHLESSQSLIESNSERINKVSEQLSSVVKPAPAASPGSPGESLSGTPAALPEGQEVIEKFKEEVKKELKEERKTEEMEAQRKWFAQMHEKEKEKWKKQMGEEFPKLALKIGLSPTQEFAIREIAEEAFKKLMALMEEAMTKPWEEVDWAAYQEQTQKIYKDAEERVSEMVTEEQGEALRKFFEEP